MNKISRLIYVGHNMLSYKYKYILISGICQMNYLKIYDQLIERAKCRKLTGYKETHHIIPKSMGGTDKKENLVELTAREHLIAHILLWKIYRNSSMSAALWFMSNSRGIRINSRIYENLRTNFANNVSIQMTGKKVSEETREKMSRSFKGRVFSDEHKENIGKSSKGRPNKMKGQKLILTDEERKKRGDTNRGKNLGKNNVMSREDVREKHRLAISSADYKENRKRKMSGHRPFNFRKVLIEGVSYESIIDASRKLGISYNVIRRRLNSEKFPEYMYV